MNHVLTGAGMRRIGGYAGTCGSGDERGERAGGWKCNSKSTGRETGRLAKRERASVFYIALLCVLSEVSVLVGYCVVSGQSHA